MNARSKQLAHQAFRKQPILSAEQAKFVKGTMYLLSCDLRENKAMTAKERKLCIEKKLRDVAQECNAKFLRGEEGFVAQISLKMLEKWWENKKVMIAVDQEVSKNDLMAIGRQKLREDEDSKDEGEVCLIA